MTKAVPIPSRFSTWFLWLGQFLSKKPIEVAENLSVAVASDWSARVGKDRKSVVIGATVTATLKLTDEQAAILSGESALPLTEGAALRCTKPLLSLFNLSRVQDGKLFLPDGIQIELDGLPDPTALSVEITDSGSARVNLRGPVGVPIHVDLVPGP